MAHESFENNGVATVINRLFINTNVYREERTGLDHIYQTTNTMLTQRSSTRQPVNAKSIALSLLEWKRHAGSGLQVMAFQFKIRCGSCILV